MPKKIQVILVEDSPDYRETLTLAIEREDDIELSSQFGTAEEALRSLEDTKSKRLPPDVILLDLNLPGLSGIEAIPHILNIAPDSRIIVLTQSNHESDVLSAISAGARGYLLKASSAKSVGRNWYLIAAELLEVVHNRPIREWV